MPITVHCVQMYDDLNCDSTLLLFCGLQPNFKKV